MNFPRRSGALPQRPDMFDHWLSKFPTSHGGIATALNTLAKGYRQLSERVQMIDRDEIQTPAGKLVHKAKSARTILKPQFEALKAARENAAAHARQLEEAVTAAYSPKDSTYEKVMLRQEIRALMRNMDSTQRMKFMDDAQKGDDQDVLIAACSQNHQLVGLPAGLQQVYRDSLIMKSAGREYAQLTALREHEKLAEQFEATMMSSVGDLIDFAAADRFIAGSTESLADQYSS